MSLLPSSKVANILVISLSNIGDIILTFPVIDILRENFPNADLSVVTGPKGETLLSGNPALKSIYVFHKKQPFYQTIKWIFSLRRQHFDLVVDLRNTAIPAFLGAKFTTPFFSGKRPGEHMRAKHLRRLRSVYPFPSEAKNKCALQYSIEDGQFVDDLLKRKLVAGQKKMVLVAPGAADQGKRWPFERFAAACDEIINRYDFSIIFIGDQKDTSVVEAVMSKMRNKAMDFSGLINLKQLACLIGHATMMITNDSAPLHMASYLGLPVLGLFGPTDPCQYGPWSLHSASIKKAKPPGLTPEECMEMISPDEVLEAVEKMLANIFGRQMVNG